MRKAPGISRVSHPARDYHVSRQHSEAQDHDCLTGLRSCRSPIQRSAFPAPLVEAKQATGRPERWRVAALAVRKTRQTADDATGNAR